MKERKYLREKQRIVVKIGTTTITHAQTGSLDLLKLERMVRILTDLNNRGKEVIVVSSGAIGVGRKTLGLPEAPKTLSLRQACASVGQAKLMMVYQKLFAEYNQLISQVLMTRYTMENEVNRSNAQNTFQELLKMNVIPIVNENDTVSTDEIEFGDNDTLSAIVAALVKADLLVLMSDIDGLFTEDPHQNPQAVFIDEVDEVDERFEAMAKGSGTAWGTGGMATKLAAAKIANEAGADMVIANGGDIFNISRVLEGQQVGTLFRTKGSKKGGLL